MKKTLRNMMFVLVAALGILAASNSAHAQGGKNGNANTANKSNAPGKANPGAKNNDPKSRKTVLTKEEVEMIHRKMTADRRISFRFPADGCYARAQMMIEQIEQMGFGVGRAWTFAIDKREPLYVKTPNHPDRFVVWNYHVAPALKVRHTDGKLYYMVIDPSMFDRPVFASTWKRAQKHPQASRDPHLTFTKLREAPLLADGKRVPGDGYWPAMTPQEGASHHAREVCKTLKPWEGRVAPKHVLERISRSFLSPGMPARTAAALWEAPEEMTAHAFGQEVFGGLRRAG
jgi:hypothetical protein